MENNKLLDVSYYYLENANNGILNIVNNSDKISEGQYNDILNEENIKKIKHLYNIALEDIEGYLSSCYNYLKEELNKIDFKNKMSDFEYLENSEYNAIGIDIELKTDDNKKIVFIFYISIVYNGYTYMDEKLDKPKVFFELFIENKKIKKIQDLNDLRKKRFPDKCDKMVEWFEDNDIYAYEKVNDIDLKKATSKEIAKKAVEFIKKYYEHIINDIKELQNR